jgi:hypothetical protein
MNQFNFDCKYRLGCASPAICSWQSNRLGHIVTTSNTFCNQCPDHVRSNGYEDKDFLKKCFNRRYDKNFLSKLYNKYNKENIITIPNNWNEVNNQFCYLKNYDWFIDIGLTGSYIVDGLSNHKDIDIIFWIKNIENYADWLKYNTLPNYFQNIKVDYYIFLEPYYQFFISLWPNQKTIYVNNYFTTNIMTSSDIKIIYNDYYEKLLEANDIVIY